MISATVIPTKINSREVQIDFSFLLFAAMAIKGASVKKESRGKEGINQARLNKMVPARNSVAVGILFFFAINDNYNFAFHFCVFEMANDFSQRTCNGLFVYLGKFP